MTDLVKVNYDNSQRPTVLGRDLHKALGVNTRYNDWFMRMCEFGFEEGRDFYPFLSKSEGGRPSTDHQLTIRMAKEICMIQRTDIGKKCREYFLEIERRYNEQIKALTPEELIFEQARIMLEHGRRLTAVEEKVNALEAKMETRPTNYYTISGYASIRGINVDINRANMLGRRAAKLSRQNDYEITKTQDPRFGAVNVYHEDILKIVFEEAQLKSQ